MATSGFLVEVAPVDLEGLRKQYPEAFGRPYSESAGLRVERVLAKGDRAAGSTAQGGIASPPDH